MINTPKYIFRFFFDAGSGSCLWGANEITQKVYGYSVPHRNLPLSENTWRALDYLVAWFDTSIDWRYPFDPSPWSKEEETFFNLKVTEIVEIVKKEFGSEYEIIDERE